MNDLKLVNPCKQYLESYLEACRESKDENVESVHYKDPDKYDEWKNTLVQSAEDNSKGIGLPEGYVPCTIYWLVDGKNFIGQGSIRHYLNDNLKQFGGHIGYFIRKKYWGMGYGTLQLKLLLQKAKELGIENALLTCNVNNIASYRVMEKNGGERIGTEKVMVDNKEREIYKYNIPVR